MDIWNEAQAWEEDWWGLCLNTYGEEYKQLLYADRMGLKTFHDGKGPYNFNVQERKILDIGGGPVSLLLKCANLKAGKVVEPLALPAWVHLRYETAGIEFENIPGETIDESGWDEVWIYNVLQHTYDPAQIIKNAQAAGKIIRLFEWLDTHQNIGHPQVLSAAILDDCLRGEGKVEVLNGQSNCHGKCYYGIFLGNGELKA
jgi:hypothetical protein